MGHGLQKCSYQALTDTEVSNFRDLQRMVPNEFHKHIDWDQTRTEQGTWPTKIMVNMWFAGCSRSLEMISRRFHTSSWTKWRRQDWKPALIGNPRQRPMHCFTKVSRKWEEMNPR